MLRYFWGSLLFTAACLAASAALGWSITGSLAGAGSALFICLVLGVLEVSLSFDNAVVNATVLKDMSPFWRGMFLTLGVAIAVFGMRLVFPLVIVAIAAKLDPLQAVTLAVQQPDRYAAILTGAHTGIMAFGGAFLMMVGLKYFFDADKEVHWIASVERRLCRLANLEAVEIALVLVALYGVSRLLARDEAFTFIVSGLFGLLTFIVVEAMGSFMEATEEQVLAVRRAGLASFLYLEVLDASFSFDGVIGAFALSNNLFIIALGLGIGAMFVRSMTILLVEKQTLAEFRFLEHGAFWAILVLAAIMFAQARWHIPEVVTGFVGALLIGLALLSSIRWNRRALLQARETETTAITGKSAAAAETG